MKLKFKTRRGFGKVKVQRLVRNKPLGQVQFFGTPRLGVRPRTLKFKTKHTSPMFGSFLSIPRPSSVSIFSRGINRPAASFYGDSDGDGVMNGFDCAPNNKKLQGPEHKKRKGYIVTLNLSPEEKTEYEKTGVLKNKEGRIVIRNLGPAFEKDSDAWKKHQRWRQEMGYLKEHEKKDNIFLEKIKENQGALVVAPEKRTKTITIKLGDDFKGPTEKDFSPVKIGKTNYMIPSGKNFDKNKAELIESHKEFFNTDKDESIDAEYEREQEYDPDEDIKSRGYDSAEQYYKENAPDKEED